MRPGGVALCLVLVAGCAAPTPPPQAPTPTPIATQAPRSATPPAAAVLVDDALLEVLPATVHGVPRTSDPTTAAEVAADPALHGDIESMAIGVYARPGASDDADIAVATVAQLRDGVFSDAFFRDWRDSFDDSVCEQAGGVATVAETTIAERQVFIGTCGGGVRTYHVHLSARGLLISIQALGERRFGERIVAGLTE